MVISDEQISGAIDAIYKRYPGQRISVANLISAVLRELNVAYMTPNYSTTCEKISEWIHNACLPGGGFQKVVGRTGGVFRSGRLNEVVNAPTPAAASCNEKACKQCTRNNTIGDSKCWWCECPNPTGA